MSDSARSNDRNGRLMRSALRAAFAVLEEGSDDLARFLHEVHANGIDGTDKTDRAASAAGDGRRSRVDAVAQAVEEGLGSLKDALTDERYSARRVGIADKLGEVLQVLGQDLVRVSNAAVGSVDSGPRPRPIRTITQTLAHNVHTAQAELWVVNRGASDDSYQVLVSGSHLRGPIDKSHFAGDLNVFTGVVSPVDSEGAQRHELREPEARIVELRAGRSTPVQLAIQMYSGGRPGTHVGIVSISSISRTKDHTPQPTDGDSFVIIRVIVEPPPSTSDGRVVDGLASPPTAISE